MVKQINSSYYASTERKLSQAKEKLKDYFGVHRMLKLNFFLKKLIFFGRLITHIPDFGRLAHCSYNTQNY